jgi:uncharacterized protein
MPELEPLRIAIVGAGASGLSVAYELGCRVRLPQGGRHRPLHVDVFEAEARVGGNAVSGYCRLGLQPRGRQPHLRFVDLGVNDMNVTAYPNVVRAMNDVGYAGLQPLEDSACFYTPDGRVRLTVDDGLQCGVTDPRYELADLEGGDLAALQRLIARAADGLIGPDPLAPALEPTVGAFFEACVSDPRAALERWGPDWPSAAQWADVGFVERLVRLVARLRDEFFLPRMSAMYFASDGGPEHVPLAAPFCYYRTQEGLGNADRRYFAGGSQPWLRQLADWMSGWHERDAPGFRCRVLPGHRMRVRVAQDGFEVMGVAAGSAAGGRYDRCVVATHADEAAALLEFAPGPAPVRDQENLLRGQVLERVRYAPGVAVAHTWSGVLPPTPNLWRSYNVLIREGQGLKPYSMTYVCNRHQNDAGRVEFDRAGMPLFFVTLNPQQRIPDEHVLSWADDQDLSDAQRVEQAQLGHPATGAPGADVDPRRAVAWFRHNVLDLAGMRAQQTLRRYHQDLPGSGHARLYFSGGWTRGAGLHEECWLQAADLADWLLHG